MTFTAGARCPLSRDQWLARRGAGKLSSAPQLDRSLHHVITVHTRAGAGSSERDESGGRGTELAMRQLSPVPDVASSTLGPVQLITAHAKMHHHVAYKMRDTSRQSSPGETGGNVAVIRGLFCHRCDSMENTTYVIIAIMNEHAEQEHANLTVSRHHMNLERAMIYVFGETLEK